MKNYSDKILKKVVSKISKNEKKMEKIKNKIYNFTKINDLNIELVFGWASLLSISISNLDLGLKENYFEFKFRELKSSDKVIYIIEHNQKWESDKDIDEAEMVDTLVDIAEVLKHIKNNKKRYIKLIKKYYILSNENKDLKEFKEGKQNG